MSRTHKAIWAQKKRLNVGECLKQQLVNGVEKAKYLMRNRTRKEVHGVYPVTQNVHELSQKIIRKRDWFS